MSTKHLPVYAFHLMVLAVVGAAALGDPDKPGIYVIRAKFPPHVMDNPHWHPNARYVTVLEGTWYTGTGGTFDLARAVPLKPGSIMMHPAKAPHWDGSAGNETVIVQIIGEGPAGTTPIDPKQPFWIDVRQRTAGATSGPRRF